MNFLHREDGHLNSKRLKNLELSPPIYIFMNWMSDFIWWHFHKFILENTMSESKSPHLSWVGLILYIYIDHHSEHKYVDGIIQLIQFQLSKPPPTLLSGSPITKVPYRVEL